MPAVRTGVLGRVTRLLVDGVGQGALAGRLGLVVALGLLLRGHLEERHDGHTPQCVVATG